jgi:urease accessory protein
VIRAFKSVPVAHNVYRLEALPAAASVYRRDAATLGWEDRLKIRARRESDTGFEFATTLPRGTVLRDGDCFVFDDLKIVVCVQELAEPVLVIRPASPREWGLFAYHIGNGHQPVMLTDTEIICADLLGMGQILGFHGIPFVREERPFTPVGQIPDHRHSALP